MSHICHDLLSKSANTLKISGGGLKSFIKTRWTSMYESTYSIVRMRKALEEVIFSIFIIIYHYSINILWLIPEFLILFCIDNVEPF